MAKNAEPFAFKCSLLLFKQVLLMLSLSINETLCFLDKSSIFLLSWLMPLPTSISCLVVIPDTPIFEFGNLDLILRTRLPIFFAQTSADSTGMSFVPAWIITWEGVEFLLIVPSSASISPDVFPACVYLFTFFCEFTWVNLLDDGVPNKNNFC